jgi:anti-sigma B factor antagonist
MEIMERKVGGVSVVALGGRLDAYVSNDVEQKLNELVDADEVRLVVSLEGLDYISSSGLRVLLASLKKVRKREGDIKLACMRPQIKEVFDVAGFSQLFSIYDLEDVAVRAFSEKQP